MVVWFLPHEAAQSAVMPQYVICLSICLSVCLWHWGMIFTQDGILWKQFHDRIAYGFCLGWPQHGRSGATGTPPKLGLNAGGVTQEHKKPAITQEHKKPAISPKRCKIGLRLLWRTNRKLHMRFQLVLKSVTLDDLERRIQGLPKVFKYPI